MAAILCSVLAFIAKIHTYIYVFFKFAIQIPQLYSLPQHMKGGYKERIQPSFSPRRGNATHEGFIV